MKIDIICNDGSPLGVTEKTLRGEDGRLGVGGAEYGLLTLCAGWQFYGNQVTLYNDPREGGASSFEQRTIDSFNPTEPRDILIVFRSPNERINGATGYKVWWSCDSYTIGDFREYATRVQKVVCISPHHAKYFKNMYGIQEAIPIDLPVRTWEYKEPVEKISKRCIFTSMPDRGLMQLAAIWPRIQGEVPDASLAITSDWRLWAEWVGEEPVMPYRLAFAGLPNIVYRGAVTRKELTRLQLEAQVHLYPCIFEEMFCIAVAESQVAGVVPITTDAGSLPTTNMGRVIHGNPNDGGWQEVFIRNTLELLTDPERLQKQQDYLREVSRKRFSLENILEQWDKKVFGHG